MEAEAITRLTDGLQPPAIRAILVQCLVGELSPSAAISRMLGVEGASTVRAAIDDVTHRAATVSRASDMLVHDRVDELTQIFVEKVSEVSDLSDLGGRSDRTDIPDRSDMGDTTMRRTGYDFPPVSRFSGYGNRGESPAA
jgi:hypothetical protein